MNIVTKYGIGFLLLSATWPAAAADTLIENMQSCRTITDISKRASCYDKFVDEENARIEANSLPRDPVRDFGVRDIPVPKKVREEELDSISTVVKSVSTSSNGGWVIMTETDAIWVQSSSDGPARSPKVGQTIELKRAAMGSYMAKVDGGRAFRVKRSQ